MMEAVEYSRLKEDDYYPNREAWKVPSRPFSCDTWEQFASLIAENAQGKLSNGDDYWFVDSIEAFEPDDDGAFFVTFGDDSGKKHASAFVDGNGEYLSRGSLSSHKRGEIVYEDPEVIEIRNHRPMRETGPKLDEASVRYATRKLDHADYWKRVGKAFKAGRVTGETFGDKDVGSRVIEFYDCDYVIPGTEIKLTRVSISQSWRTNGTPSKPATSIDYADAKGNWGDANFGRYANFYGDSDEKIADGIVKDIADSAKDYLSYWYEDDSQADKLTESFKKVYLASNKGR